MITVEPKHPSILPFAVMFDHWFSNSIGMLQTQITKTIPIRNPCFINSFIVTRHNPHHFFTARM